MTTIKKICIIGEKCTGAMYLGKLIKKNLKNDIPITRDCYFVDLFDDDLLSTSDEILYIVVYRDFIDWSKCYYKNHFAKDSNNKNITYMDFLKSKWNPVDEDGDVLIYERNLMTLEHFPNVFSVRKAKLINHLNIKNIVKNVYVVQYEKLKNEFAKIIQEISTQFKVPLIEKIETIPFVEERVLLEISDDDKSYIYENLDVALEKKLGYEVNIRPTNSSVALDRENIKDVIKEILKQSSEPKTTAEIITGAGEYSDCTEDKVVAKNYGHNKEKMSIPLPNIQILSNLNKNGEVSAQPFKKKRGFARAGGSGLNTLIKKTTSGDNLVKNENIIVKQDQKPENKNDDRKKMVHKKVMSLY